MTKFYYLKLSKSKKIRYLKHIQKNSDYIVFLHGFMSDLEGKKPKIFLNSIKDNVQISLKSPKFDVHLTLCGPYEKLDHDFLFNLNNLSNKNQSIILNLEKFDFSDEKFKSFFIKTNNSFELNNLKSFENDLFF